MDVLFCGCLLSRYILITTIVMERNSENLLRFYQHSAEILLRFYWHSTGNLLGFCWESTENLWILLKFFKCLIQNILMWMLNVSSLGWKSTYHYLASCLQVLLNDIYNDLMKALDFQLLQINDHFWNRGAAASTGSFLLEAKTMGSKDF